MTRDPKGRFTRKPEESGIGFLAWVTILALAYCVLLWFALRQMTEQTRPVVNYSDEHQSQGTDREALARNALAGSNPAASTNLTESSGGTPITGNALASNPVVKRGSNPHSVALAKPKASSTHHKPPQHATGVEAYPWPVQPDRNEWSQFYEDRGINQ